MGKRFVTIWFRFLKTDWLTNRRPALAKTPFVLCLPEHGRMIITAVNPMAKEQGIEPGMVVADARAVYSGLEVFDDNPAIAARLLQRFAEFCIRFCPTVVVDPPDGLVLDVSGCPHLWGGERSYLDQIIHRLGQLGYHASAGMSDTIGSAWAISRFTDNNFIIPPGRQEFFLREMNAAALRLDTNSIALLQKLGLYRVNDFIDMPRSALRRRFGETLLTRLDQALGYEDEIVFPVQPAEFYSERLQCIEPVSTLVAIGIALNRLLDVICSRLRKEQKGIRSANFKCYRVDGKIETIAIGTHRATHNQHHLLSLFEVKLSSIEPALGIELFILEAPEVETILTRQENIWNEKDGLEESRLAELIDRVAGRIGTQRIQRYLPAAHYWPERSYRPADSLFEKKVADWPVTTLRPVHLLPQPQPIEVMAPVPDYPPMQFRYRNKLYKVNKADGPERIEQEWWIEDGVHRDYYCVEDEEGQRYWLFRSGHYTAEKKYQWFLHGFFA